MVVIVIVIVLLSLLRLLLLLLLLLPGSRALVRLCPDGLNISCVHTLILSFSRAIMMLSVCRLYRKYRRIIVRNQNASPLNIADERANRASKAVS